ncbi:peptidoglycan editing factor PgeF [bacterium]|nr:peptidoglycan editing factor PgeF [bacterium]
MFYFEQINGNRILKSDLIKRAEAFFTTRDICICDKGTRVNEDEITRNKKLIADYLGIESQNLVFPTQTHSTNIAVASISQKDYPETDGLILTRPDLAIFLNFADCTPVILYDEKQNIGAVSHAGWRGTAGKIAGMTVEKMKNEFNSNPLDIVALIGPAIGFCCYDVGEEVFEKLSASVSDFSGLYEIREGKIFVDLKNINKRQLEEAGVGRIDVCSYCTVHNNDLFYSYRNENGTTLRHSAVLKLN